MVEQAHSSPVPAVCAEWSTYSLSSQLLAYHQQCATVWTVLDASDLAGA